jgi:hypothetical protein
MNDQPTSGTSTTSTTSSKRQQALPAFHVDPPRKFQVEMPALDCERLEQYASFYNESTGGKQDTSSVAAAIVSHFIARDRNFKRWQDQRAKAK